MTKVEEDKVYIKYARDVIEGREIAGKLIKLACERFLSWFDRDDIWFDFDDVDSKIRFIGKFKLTEDPFTGQPFILLPYQQWIMANIYGFKYINTNDRVIKNALLLMARKQGKTALAAALMLCSIVKDNKISVTGYTIANSSDQSALAFKQIDDLCESVDSKQKFFDRGRFNIIRIPKLKSHIKVLASDKAKLHGLNPQVFIQDEAHQAKTNKIWGDLKTGMGARHNPLALCISTAGFLVGDDYPLYAQWHMCKNILEGTMEDDAWFAALYQIDDTDDWKDKTVWKKANPSLGRTVKIEALEEAFINACNNPADEVYFKTTQLNMWCQSETTWITNEAIKAVTQPFDYHIFNKETEYIVMGVDIAERDDLCVLTTLVDHEDKLYFKAYPFVCDTALERSPNKDLYKIWIKNGYMIHIHEPSIDIDWVIKKVEDIEKEITVGVIGYDPKLANQFAVKCNKAGHYVKPVGQGLAAFGEPTTELEQQILAKTVVIDDNPVIRWCFSNVLIKQDENQNKKPVKSAHHNKIDIVVAMIQSVKLWMDIHGYGGDSDLKSVVLEN